MKRLWTPILLVAALLATSCSRGEAATPPSAKAPPAADRPAAGALPRLVFFMNPNGMPCQMQDRILNEMASELKGKVDLVYYRTTSQSDLGWFQAFGIRSLPSLVLTDASGKEIRRATPGIQSADAVRQLIAN